MVSESSLVKSSPSRTLLDRTHPLRHSSSTARPWGTHADSWLIRRNVFRRTPTFHPRLCQPAAGSHFRIKPAPTLCPAQASRVGSVWRSRKTMQSGTHQSRNPSDGVRLPPNPGQGMIGYTRSLQPTVAHFQQRFRPWMSRVVHGCVLINSREIVVYGPTRFG